MDRNFFLNAKNINKLSTLIHLRWCINIHGIDVVSESINVSTDILKEIKKIDLPNETVITDYFSKTIEEISLIKNEIKSKYEYDDYFISESHANAIAKNQNLIRDLQIARDKFLGIGTNKTKRRLNKISETDVVAKAVRIALEIEDKNIQAKNSYGKYKDKIYNEKENLIEELIDLFLDQEDWNFGVERKKERDTNCIVYFEIPNCEQISWHVNLPGKFPTYNKIWDGKENSTLWKLEDKIKKDYPQIIY